MESENIMISGILSLFPFLSLFHILTLKETAKEETAYTISLLYVPLLFLLSLSISGGHEVQHVNRITPMLRASAVQDISLKGRKTGPEGYQSWTRNFHGFYYSPFLFFSSSVAFLPLLPSGLEKRGPPI